MTTDEFKTRLMDRARESRFAYWNALLTLNGILITAFSAVGILGKANKWIILGLVSLSIVSAWLLIQNFRCFRDLYLHLGQQTADEVAAMTEQQKEAEDNKQSKVHESMNNREEFVERFLFVQAFLIILILFTQT
jgi:hypothetical protein